MSIPISLHDVPEPAAPSASHDEHSLRDGSGAQVAARRADPSARGDTKRGDTGRDDSGPPERPGSLIDSALGAFEMTWQRLFPGHADQVPNARRFVRALLADTTQANDAELIVSELAGNALRHSRSGRPGGRFLVELRRGKRIRIAVYDAGGGDVPRLPGPGEPVLFGEGGRGLFMVAAVADEIGREGGPAVGHVVWACLSLDEPERAGAG